MQELTNSQLENIPCTNKTHKIVLLIMHVYFSKLTTFLWIILIRHPGRSSLLLEIVIINSKYFDAQIIILFLQIRNINGNLSYSYYDHVTVVMFQA